MGMLTSFVCLTLIGIGIAWIVIHIADLVAKELEDGDDDDPGMPGGNLVTP